MANREPARILEDNSEARLCLALADLRDSLPSAAELARLHGALHETLDSEDDAGWLDTDSGVRLAPQPRHLQLVTPASDAGEPERPRRAAVSRLGACAVTAVATALAIAASVLVTISVQHEPGPSAVTLRPIDPPASVVASNAEGHAPEAPREVRAEPTPEPPPPPPPWPRSARRAGTASLAASEAGNADAVRNMKGRISINSIPVSAVVLDGRPLGGTPRIGVTVSPGEHRVVFIHPEHGRRYRTVSVDVGRTAVAAVRFQ